MGITSQSQGVEVKVMVYPACRCGAAYALHLAPGCDAGGYAPSRPIENWGTRAYAPPRSLPLWRRTAAVAIWAVEWRCAKWRERIGPIR